MPRPARPCVFCSIVAGETAASVVAEEEHLIAFLDTAPLFPGHTLLVPQGHVQTFAELPAELAVPFMAAAQRLERAVENAMGADGSLLIVNNVVSQSVPHLHLHVIPRRRKDGLRLWLGPRHRYPTPEDAASTAERIAAAYRGDEAGRRPDPRQAR